MGNMFGSPSVLPQSPNFVASGSGVYVSDTGETVHETFHHVNGELTRQISTGSSFPSSTAFFQPQHTENVQFVAPVAATIMLVMIIAMFIYSRRTKRPVKRAIAVVEDPENATHIPLYSINAKVRPTHPSDAMWNIDLLDEEIVRA